MLAQLFLAIHLLLLALWLAGALAAFIPYPVPRLSRIAAALLFPATLLLLDAGGWWTEIPRKVLLGSGFTALVWLSLQVIGHRTGSMVARALAAPLLVVPMGFFLALGALCLRNGGPLDAGMAWKAIVLGALYGTVVGGGRRPAKPAACVAMLLLAVGVGLTVWPVT